MTFFSFQDIMSCVTGIMILVTLLMALEPMSDKPNPVQKSGAAVDWREKLENARQRVAQAQGAVAQAKAAIEEVLKAPQITASQLARMEKLLADELDGFKQVQALREQAEGEATRLQERVIQVTGELEVAGNKMRAIEANLAESAMRRRIQYMSGTQEPLKPLLMEVTPEGIVLGTLDEKGTPVRASVVHDAALDKLLLAWQRDPSAAAKGMKPQDSKALHDALKEFPPDAWYGLLIIRQDAVPGAVGLRDLMRAIGYEMGWQVWDNHDGGFFEAPTLPLVPESGEKP